MSAPPQDVNEWLNIATDDLCAVAKKRIRLEIESHFQEAVDAHRSDGQTEAQAQTTALKDLGDAEVWAKHFRKSHLTGIEAERLAKQWVHYSKKKDPLDVGKTCVNLLCSLYFISRLEVHGAYWAIFATIQIGLEIGECMIVRSKSLLALRWLTRMDLLGWMCMLAFFAFCQGWVASMCVLFVIFMLPGRKIPLWLKIGKMDRFWEEIPQP
jgi:hypothetical protein